MASQELLEHKTQNKNHSLNKAARRMNKLNLQAIAKKKFKVTTDSKHSKKNIRLLYSYLDFYIL